MGVKRKKAATKPATVDPVLQSAMYECARRWGDLSRSHYDPMTFSGDPITGERYRLVTVAFRELGTGADLESTLKKMWADWRAFCAENNRKVDAAAKFKSGPRAGQSVIQHRYAYPEALEGPEIHIRTMYRNAKEVKKQV